ncbi:MAG TPA: S9 family peptidase [Acidobacteriota bacterium]|nr:S9 family peptidase [Acidobacteriota bacterium]
MRTCSVAVSMLLCLATAALSAQDAERAARPMVPDDYYTFRQISDVQISPNGEEVLFVVADVSDDRRRRDRALWIVASDGASEARPLSFGTTDGSPRWSPDGSTIAFLRNGAEVVAEGPSDGETAESPQVYLLPRGGGEARQASTVEGGVGGLQWLPDGKRLLLTLAGPRPPQPDDPTAEPKPDLDIVKDAFYKANGRGYLDQRRRHLFLFDVDSGTTVQLTDGTDWNDSAPHISSDGSALVFSSDRTGLEYDGGSNSDIWRVNLDDVSNPQSSAPVQLTTQEHRDSGPRISPDGTTVAYSRTDAPYDQPDVFVQALDGSGSPRNMTASFDRNPGSLSWSHDSSAMLLLADDKGSRGLFRLDVSSGDTTRLLEPDWSVRSLSVASRSDRIAFTLDDEQMLPEVFVANADGSSMRQLTRLNDAVLAQLARGELEEIHFTNDVGGDVQAFLLRPVGGVEGKVPLVLNIKGGPGGMWGYQWFHENQMLAGKGWAVAFVNYRGSTGYGDAHQSAVRLDYGGVDYRDNMQLVDELLARYDWIDAERLFVTGGSHGGFLTNWITTQTQRFRAAVTQRSVASWVSEAGTQQYTPSAMRDEFGGNLWENWDLYWDRSPLKHANKVTTPTLIIHSDQDMICPLGQAEEWFYALKNNDVDTELLVFRGEDHGLSRTGTPVNLVERLRRIIDWFERHGG